MRHCLAVLAVLLPAWVATAAERTWTDVKGRQMRADFVRESGGSVTFLKDGKLVDFPLADLSARDQQAVRDLAAGKPVADDTDPPKPPDSPASPSAAPPSAASPSAASQPASDEPPAAAAKKPIAIIRRVWTDKFGNQSQARFVRMFGNFVALTKINNQTIRVPFYDLTSEDQDYVRELLASQGNEVLIPPPPPPPPTETPPPAAPSPSPAPGFTPPSFTPPSFTPPSFSPPSFSPPPGAEEARQRFEQMQQESRQRLEQLRQEQAQRDAERAQKLQESLDRQRQEFAAIRQNRTVGECLSCKGKLTQAQTEQATCPHCGVKWEYEVDAFGHRKPIYRITPDSGSGNSAGTGVPKLDPATIAQARRIIVIGVAVVGVLGMFAVVVFVAITVAAAGSAKSRQKFY